MKKLFLIVSILIGCCCFGNAQNVDRIGPTQMPAPQMPALQSIDNGKITVETPRGQKHRSSAGVRKAINATAEDFIGDWAWKGYNSLTIESLPNSGMMTIKQNPSDPTRLVVEIPVPSIELDGYVKDGKLYIPNQDVAPGYWVGDRTDVRFINYTFRNVDDVLYVVPAETQEFYFQINDDYKLSAGVPTELLPDLYSMTNEELEKMVCVGTLPTDGAGYFWACRFITASNKIVYKDGITYSVDPNQVSANVVTSDNDIENAVIDGVVTWEGLDYPVKEIYSRAFGARQNLKSVSIPSEVQHINASAFQDCVSLEKVKIPNSVYSIGDYVFSRCYGLTECDLGNSVEYLGTDLFSLCENLKQITVPNSVTQMGQSFRYCYGLESVTLGNSLLEVPTYSFVNCINLKEVNFGTSLKNIGYAAFNGCVSLENLDVTSPVENIEGWAFSLCPSLKTVKLPASLVTFDPSMFAYDENLQSVEVDPASQTYVSRDGVVYLKDGSSLELFPAGRGGVFNVPDGVTAIGFTAFHSCVKVREIVLPESVVELGIGAFVNCLNLRSINIPQGVSVIPIQLFTNTPSLTEVRLPASIETIEELAFENCTSLTNIELGEGVTLIKDSAFSGCNALSAIYSLTPTPPEAGEEIFPQDILSTAKLYVPQTSLTAYLDAAPWNEFASINRIGGALTLSESEVTLEEKEVMQLGVYGSANKVVWTSSNAEVAYANDCGLIVARKAGTSTITATADGLSASCVVTVVSSQERASKRRVDEEILEPTDIVIESVGGNPPMVNLRLIPVGSRTVIDWSTSDNSVAKVEDGLVIILGEGEVDFSVESSNGLDDSFETETTEIEMAAVFAIGEDPMLNNIYTLQGICIKKGATIKDIEALPAGFYIIGGRKVLKK